MAWPKWLPLRKKNELDRLRRSEAQFRALAEGAGDLLVQYDAAGVIQYASPSATNLGFEPHELIGRHVAEFSHDEDRDLQMETLRQIQDGLPPRRGVENELRLRRKDGSSIWAQGHPSPLYDDNGRLVGVVTILRDVTEQRVLKDRLRESEARYRMLADHASDYIIQYGADGVIQFASPSVAAFGYEPSDLVGLRTFDFCHPDDRTQIVENTRRALSGESSPGDHWPAFRLRAKDGSYVWMEGNPGLVKNADGDVESVVTVLRDVTERQALEALLAAQRVELEGAFDRVAESEQRYRLLAEQSPDITIRYDLQGRIDYVSPAIRRYGVEPESLIGRNVGALVDPAERDRNDAWMADLAAGRELPQGRQNVWRSPLDRGGWVDWEGSTSPLLENGKVVGAISVLRDVTERVALEEAVEAKQAEMKATLEQLRDSEARYRVLAENASDVILRIGKTGLIEFASPSINVFGYPAGATCRRAPAGFVHPDDFTGNVREAIRSREQIPQGAENEFRLLCADGRWAWVQASTASIRDDTGGFEGVVQVLRDVTEQRRLEDELRRKEADAQAAVSAKAEFLANMSHEIRTPLTAVVGFSGLLAKIPGLPEKALTYADRIGRSGDALATIVNNVLDFSRVEAGQVELKPEPVDIATVIEDALGVVREQAAAKGLN